MNFKLINAYYFSYLNDIGGIESHLCYISRKYAKNYDITILYRNGSQKQVDRLRQYVNVIKVQPNDTIECENIFCCFNRDILDQCKWKKSYLVLHGDYKDMLNRGQLLPTALPMDQRIDEYLGVSQLVCDSWEEITGIKARNVYQPVELEKCEKPLLFISATRLTKEKGYERMVRLASQLDASNVNYQWFVYTDSPKMNMENITFLKPRLDITDKLASFDAYIQLSDNEGYCLSVVEALKRKVPVIVTDLPVLKELGLNETNSIVLPMDMSEIPVDRIRNIWKLKVNYTEPKDKWNEVLTESKPKYKGVTKKNQKVFTIKATGKYKQIGLIDAQLHRVPEPNEMWNVTEERLQAIRNYEKEHEVRLIEML